MSETRDVNASGKLFGVGVGPGDPELLTLKAVRVIQAVGVIAVPCVKREGDSYALQIVHALLRPEQTVVRLHFPMVRDLAVRARHRQRAAETVVAHLAQGLDVAFLTEGDPLLYSTFVYLLERMPEGTPVEIVPGISSFNAAAAQARLPLVQADQPLALLPATVENLARLPDVLALFDTVVLFKLHRTFERVLEALDALDATERAVLVERASHLLGRVVRDVRSLQKGQLHYMSLLILPHRDEVKDVD
jgi:precorrin-2/cobalt-factor-2 C20-methyltransferase